MTSTMEPGAPQQPGRTNPFERLAGIFISPAETLRSIAARPDWLVPFLLILVVSIGANFVVAPHIDLEPQVRAQVEKQGGGEEDVDRALEIVEKFGKFQSIITAVFVPIILIVTAAILLLVVKVLGGEGTFKQLFSITNYSWMPQMLKAIISTAIIAPKGMIDARHLATLLRSNLGFLADPLEAPVAFSFLSSLDAFTIWTLFLLTVGLSEASRFSRGKAATIVVILWLLMVLAKVGFAALGAA